MKNIAVLGSTGSIGTQTLEIVREQEGLKVVALAAGTNAKLMDKDISPAEFTSKPILFCKCYYKIIKFISF